MLVAVAVVAALAGPGRALAHGDPTAHYLETDPLLTSYSVPPELAVERQLRGVLDAAAARGYPIKVVLFATDGDTGGDAPALEDPQTYVGTVTAQLESVRPLQAPVLIVTPHRFGLGGRQPRHGRLTLITPALAAKLEKGIPRAKKAQGTALARTAMVVVRRLAAAAGHPLPKRIAPAKDNLNGILGGSASRGSSSFGGPWLNAALILATLLLGAMLVGVHRRLMGRDAAPHV